MQYVIRPTNSDLQHHGILGQKWGKQNGPPYPLDGSDHSSAEKKAGWKKSLNVKKLQNEDGSLTKKGQKKFSKLLELNKKDEELLKKTRAAADKEYEYVKKSGYLKGNGENYKVAAQELYADDPNFRPIADATTKAWKEQRELGEQVIKEMSNVARKDYDLFTVIGHDRVRQILRDYENYTGGHK